MDQNYTTTQKVLIYLGVVITVAGFIVLSAFFVKDLFLTPEIQVDAEEKSQIAFRAVLGIVLIIVGGYIYSVGTRGFVLISDEKREAEGNESLVMSYSKQANELESAPRDLAEAWPANQSTKNHGEWITCPACDALNASTAHYCINCNEMLKRA